MSKKIEPTAEMVRDLEFARALVGMDTVKALLVALNHPDTRGLFADVDDRPWEPLKKGDPLHVGDEVRQDYSGVTRTAVVGRVGEDGTPWTTERDLIGLLHWGTWYVRRPIVSKEEA